MVKRSGGALLLSIRIDRSAAVGSQLAAALRGMILDGGLVPGFSGIRPDEIVAGDRRLAEALQEL